MKISPQQDEYVRIEHPAQGDPTIDNHRVFITVMRKVHAPRDPVLIPESPGMIYSSYVDDPHYNPYALAVACERPERIVALSCVRNDTPVPGEHAFWFVPSDVPPTVSMNRHGKIHFYDGVFVRSSGNIQENDENAPAVIRKMAIRTCNDYNGYLRGEVYDIDVFSLGQSAWGDIDEDQLKDGEAVRYLRSTGAPAEHPSHEIAYGLNRAINLFSGLTYAMRRKDYAIAHPMASIDVIDMPIPVSQF